MEELNNQDLPFVLSRAPKDVRDLMKKNGAILGGGFIRATIAGERPNDIDLFGPSKDQLHEWAKDLALKRQGRLHETDNAFTVLAPGRVPVQLIHRWTYDKAADLIHEFDFTIAQAAIFWIPGDDEDGGGHWASLCAPTFYPDLAAKRLVYTHPARHEDAGGSLLRARKFLRAGYNIQAPALAGVVTRLLQGIDSEGVDMSDEKAVTKVVTGLLREVDPQVAIDGLEIVNEHEAL